MHVKDLASLMSSLPSSWSAFYCVGQVILHHLQSNYQRPLVLSALFHNFFCIYTWQCMYDGTIFSRYRKTTQRSIKQPHNSFHTSASSRKGFYEHSLFFCLSHSHIHPSSVSPKWYLLPHTYQNFVRDTMLGLAHNVFSISDHQFTVYRHHRWQRPQ